jgi:signal transduction histidine kinase
MSKIKPQDPISQLADHLRSRRESILNRWRTICAEDLKLVNYSAFSREEFNDHAPAVLNILDLRLRNEENESTVIEQASEHGLHRWQRGYSLTELLAELEHLYWVVLDEVTAYQQTHRPLSAENLSEVYRQVFKISTETTRGSVLYYDELRQTNAAEQANQMQQALDNLQLLGKQQAEHMRNSAHDLRSIFGILMGAASLLKLPSTKKEREVYVDMLNRNLISIQAMLLQLIDYPRIEAGQETVEVKEFDVVAVLRQSITLAQPVAQERKLALQGEGPDRLVVFSDTVLIQRIVQNLLYNSLNYTTSGGVYVSWARENDTRWILSIQDTGRGFSAPSPVAQLAKQLKPFSIPSSSHQLGGPPESPYRQMPAAEPLRKAPVHSLKEGESEGLELFIVKKLCELLKANIDIESAPGQGTLVRIRFLTRQEPSKRTKVFERP